MMHIIGTMTLLATTAMLLAGCHSDIPYRAKLDDEQLRLCGGLCTGRPVDDLKYTLDKSGAEVKYLMSYVEFDDQGWFHNEDQRYALFRKLTEIHQETGEQFLIVTFAHGWKNNANAGQKHNNVGDLQRLLERLVLMENKGAKAAGRKARTVVGVYLGWRGSSMPVPMLENLTFWARKNAAERVGGRSAKQLLMELNSLKRAFNRVDDDRPATENETQLVLIGHSFGGLVMYHALHTELMERARRIELADGKPVWGIAKGFGDFVLLVNPAFEGAAYEAMWQAARNRCYSTGQRPVMAVVTSSKDWATGIFFPLGRLYTILQSAPQPGERETVFNTVGHLDRYRTHYLRSISGKPAQPVEQPTPEDTERLLASALQAKEKKPLLSVATSEKDYDGARLERYREDGPDYMPYLVVSADPTIIPDHSQIWTTEFVDFVASFVVAEVMRGPETQPAARGCVPFVPVPDHAPSGG